MSTPLDLLLVEDNDDDAQLLLVKLRRAGYDPQYVRVDSEAGMREALTAAGYDGAELDTRVAKDPTILGSIRSCIRAPIGRGFNRMTGGGIRHGTGNECEDRFLRFYQKGGDGEVDTNPIAMLSKGEVYQVALDS